jgi:hypothetical protein
VGLAGKRIGVTPLPITATLKEAMTKFEYKCIFIWGGGEKTSRVLTEYGGQGWELVSTYWCWHYMKRVLA